MVVVKIVTFNLAGALIAGGLLLMLQSNYWNGALLWLLGLVANIVGAMARD